ncbi:hypothetical protein U1Q18_019900, partial [Sarracenia purpurea var. burkii]
MNFSVAPNLYANSCPDLPLHNPSTDTLRCDPGNQNKANTKSFRGILIQPRIKDKPLYSDAKNLYEDEMFDEAQEFSTTIDQELSKANNRAPIV